MNNLIKTLKLKEFRETTCKKCGTWSDPHDCLIIKKKINQAIEIMKLERDQDYVHKYNSIIKDEFCPQFVEVKKDE